MSIFIEGTNNNLIESLANEIRRRNTELRNTMEEQHKQIFNLIWNIAPLSENPIQDLLDVFGADAVKLFVLSSKIQDILKDADPNYQVLEPPKDYTINDDGTVTINLGE